jgi:hypothetical protein
MDYQVYNKTLLSLNIFPFAYMRGRRAGREKLKTSEWVENPFYLSLHRKQNNLPSAREAWAVGFSHGLSGAGVLNLGLIWEPLSFQ